MEMTSEKMERNEARYENKGIVQGTLARKPFLTTKGIAILVICTQSPRFNIKTKRKELVFPSFIAFGKWAETAMTSLSVGQEVKIEYHIETRKRQMPDGTFKYYEDKVATNIAAGMLPQRKRPQQTEEAPVQPL